MTYKQIALLLALAIVAGGLFQVLHIPVAWMLGPMFAGVAAAGLMGRPTPLQPLYMTAGQAVLGVVTGIGFPLATLKLAVAHAVPLLAAVLITGGLSLLNGYLLWRWAGVDRATGFMGSLPGAASSMVAMADEMGADPVAVAVLQYLRMLMVMFLVPVAVGFLFPAGAGAVSAASLGSADAPFWLNLLVLAACGVAGVWLGPKLKLPAATFLGPMLVALIVCWTVPLQFTMPVIPWNGGLLLVGLATGVRFDFPAAKRLGKAALIEVALVAGLIAVSLVVGYGFHLVTGIGTMTAVLGSTPGAMDTMVATSVNLGADTGLVLAMQMFRWFAVLLVGPALTVRLVKRSAAPTPWSGH